MRPQNILPILLVFAVIVISGCTQNQHAKDCGEGSYETPSQADECFVSNLASCSPAEMAVKSGEDVYGLQVLGSQNGCKVKVSILHAASEELSGLDGKETTCTKTSLQEFSEASEKKGQEALEFVNDLRLGIIASSLGNINSCEGSLKDYFDSL